MSDIILTVSPNFTVLPIMQLLRNG